MSVRLLFEQWIVSQFSGIDLQMLKGFDENGYRDDTINAMWVAFNAGYELRVSDV